MTREERIKAALNFQETDKIPVSIWMHYSAIDQDPLTLAKAQVEVAEKYNHDFIKLMPFGLYGVQDWGTKIHIYSTQGKPPIVAEYAIKKADDWRKLEPLPGNYGTYGNQVLLAQYVSKLTKEEIPFIQTIFSPLTTARKMAGDRILLDMKEEPEALKQGLEVITETTINFIKENINAGVSGFFFATQCCNSSFMTEDEYREFGIYYDRQVIDSYKDITWLNVGHLHGNHGMFKLFDELDNNVINWHDRWSDLNMGDARKLSKKCFMGGIREKPYWDDRGNVVKESPLETGSDEEIFAHVKEVIDEVGTRGLIFSPGCCASQFVGEKQMYALSAAVEKLSKKD